MKVTTSVLLASLASTGLAAHRGRHARFHEAKRDADIAELNKRALEQDPSLHKRCGEIINTTMPDGTPISFPNCWDACASDAKCQGQGSGSGQAAAPASSAAPAPAPAATSSSAAVQVQGDFVQPKASSANAAPAAQSTPAASSSSSGSSTPNTDTSGKIGLAYNDVSFINNGNGWLSGAATWAYNWGYQSGGLNSKLQYIPMFHDATQVNGFASQSFDSEYLLSLNEPDMSGGDGGSALSPSAACSLHNQAFANQQSHKVSAPSVSSSGASGQGLDWLQQFSQQCSGAKVDFVTLHWYGGSGSGASQAADFLSYVETAIQKVNTMYPNKPIWFTEFAAMPKTDAGVNADFLQNCLSNLTANNAIAKIAPFMVGDQGMLGTTTPSAAGKVLMAA